MGEKTSNEILPQSAQQIFYINSHGKLFCSSFFFFFFLMFNMVFNAEL